MVCPRLSLGFFGFYQPALAHGLGEILEQRYAVLPADAGVGDALAVYERLSRHQVLASRLEVRFDHDAEDALLARRDLTRDFARHVYLALIHLLAVRMAAIDHQALLEPRRGQFLRRRVDAPRVVIRVLAAAQDDVAVLVTIGRDDRRVPLLGDGEEMVRHARSFQRVHRDAHVSVGAVLESDRAGQARGELAMDLRFRGARADRTPAHQVRVVLRRDHVEKFVACRKPQLVDFQEEPARQVQPLVDLKAAVEVRIVDQPLPAHGGAGLFEIDAHDDDQVPLEFFFHFDKLARVLQARLGIVHGTRADDHEHPVVRTVKDAMNRLTRVIGQLLGLFRARELVQQLHRRRELFDLPDSDVVDFEVHGCARVQRAFSKKLKSLNFTRINPRRSAAAPLASGAAIRTRSITSYVLPNANNVTLLADAVRECQKLPVNAAKPRYVEEVRSIAGIVLAW